MSLDEILEYFSSSAARLRTVLRGVNDATTKQTLSQRIWGDSRFTKKQVNVFFEKSHAK